MSRYRGPRFKKIRHTGALQGLTNKKPGTGSDLRNQSRSGSTGQVLLQLLEMRLDNILFRLGMASTIPAARQLVNHRHILVNGRIELPNHLTLHPFQYKGLINQIIDSKWVGLKINELLVVEYYSRRT
ncbi:unnamed protein product [Withania somnifera]